MHSLCQLLSFVEISAGQALEGSRDLICSMKPVKFPSLSSQGTGAPIVHTRATQGRGVQRYECAPFEYVWRATTFALRSFRRRRRRRPLPLLSSLFRLLACAEQTILLASVVGRMRRHLVLMVPSDIHVGKCASRRANSSSSSSSNRQQAAGSRQHSPSCSERSGRAARLVPTGTACLLSRTTLVHICQTQMPNDAGHSARRINTPSHFKKERTSAFE